MLAKVGPSVDFQPVVRPVVISKKTKHSYVTMEYYCEVGTATFRYSPRAPRGDTLVENANVFRY